MNKNGFKNDKICSILGKKNIEKITTQDLEKLEKMVKFPLVMELCKYLVKTTKEKTTKSLYKSLYNGMKVCTSFGEEIEKVKKKLKKKKE